MQFSGINEFSRHLAERFRDMEEREIVVHRDRDASLVRWTIECICNPRNEWSDELLTIMRVRHDELRDELGIAATKPETELEGGGDE